MVLSTLLCQDWQSSVVVSAQNLPIQLGCEFFYNSWVRIRVESEIPNDELESQDKLDPIGSDGLSSVRNDVIKFQQCQQSPQWRQCQQCQPFQHFNIINNVNSVNCKSVKSAIASLETKYWTCFKLPPWHL